MKGEIRRSETEADREQAGLSDVGNDMGFCSNISRGDMTMLETSENQARSEGY